jgi:hypothetical protein
MGCLALNASYEPLTIIPVRRAVRLVIDRKAEALEVDDKRPFRSERAHYAAPVVSGPRRHQARPVHSCAPQVPQAGHQHVSLRP